MPKNASENRGYALRWRVFPFALVALAVTVLASPASGQIAPWIEADLYNPEVWDSAGPYADSPWYHAPPQSSEKNWGLLSPESWRDGSWQEQQSLTGTWGGLRSELFEDHGVALAGGYTAQISGNPVGGEDQGVRYAQHIGAGLFLDLDRLLGWKGGYVAASMNANWGDGLSQKDIGNLFPVQYASGNPAVRLVTLALVQNIANRVEVALGRLVMGDDFGGSVGFCASLNQAVCSTPIAASYAVSFGTFPYATWGGRIKYQSNNQWFAQVGVYAAYPSFRNPKDHGVRFGLPNDAGPLLLAEAGYIHGAWHLEKGVRGDSSLPDGASPSGGKIKLGGYSSWEVVEEQKTGRRQRGGAWGLYLIIEQDLYVESKAPSYAGAFGLGRGQGLDGFLSLSYASEQTSPLAWMAVGGLIYRGPVPGRNDDVLAFIATWGRFSEDLRDFERAAGEPRSHYELVLELNYRFELARGLFIQPDVQGIIMPDGKSEIPAALALSLNFGLAF